MPQCQHLFGSEIFHECVVYLPAFIFKHDLKVISYIECLGIHGYINHVTMTLSLTKCCEFLGTAPYYEVALWSSDRDPVARKACFLHFYRGEFLMDMHSSTFIVNR